MTSRASWLLAVALACAACGGDEPAPSRELVLAQIPDDVMLVVATDGETLASPRARAALDVLRSRWPERLRCAIDAARAARNVALGVTRARSAVLVLELADAPACRALSQITSGERALWVATLGRAAPATQRSASVLDEPRFARALPYLHGAPFALALEIPGGAAIATARPEPLEAWLALDMAPWFADAAERHVRGFVARLGAEPATAPLARQLRVTRDGPQIVAYVEASDVELASALRTILGWYDAPAAPAAIACPPLLAPVVRCTGGTRFEVTSLAALSPHVLAANGRPVIRQGGVAGVALVTPLPRLGLRAGDVVLGVDGRSISRLGELAAILRRARGSVTVAVERGRQTIRLELVPR